jgi:hypothetical protein
LPTFLGVSERMNEYHVIDFTVPMDEWQGYLCDKDGQFHKDGTTIMCNMHCIVCKAMLRERREPVPDEEYEEDKQAIADSVVPVDEIIRDDER